MSLELGIAVAAVLVSIMSFAINLRAASAAERHGRLPVMVLESTIGSTGTIRTSVCVRNIGSGPALNIVIATTDGTLASQDVLRIRVFPAWFWRRRYRPGWSEHRHLHPIGPGQQRCYRWQHQSMIAMSYTDALGNRYTLLTSEHGTRIIDGDVMNPPPLNELQYPPETR